MVELSPTEVKMQTGAWIVLPGKYAVREQLNDYELTLTFQTLEELMSYVNSRKPNNQ